MKILINATLRILMTTKSHFLEVKAATDTKKTVYKAPDNLLKESVFFSLSSVLSATF